MAANNPEYETVATLFYKITSPVNSEIDRDLLELFCAKVEKDPAGRLVACRLIVHKVQSPSEKEALMTLEVLGYCVHHCGSAFQQEIGKFKFLNELIKVISPKYLGNTTSDRVKKTVCRLLFEWTAYLRNQPKIAEAFSLLKKQGLITEDELRSSQGYEGAEAKKNKIRSVFDDECKTQRIANLLKSNNPADIVEANRLIKRLAYEDELRSERISQKMHEVNRVKTNALVLTEMIDNFHPDNNNNNHEVMNMFYQDIRSQTSILQRAATETDDNDDTIGEILEVNDLVLRVLERYRQSGMEDVKPNLVLEQTSTSDVKELINLTVHDTIDLMPNASLPITPAGAHGPADQSQELMEETLDGIFASHAQQMTTGTDGLTADVGPTATGINLLEDYVQTATPSCQATQQKLPDMIAAVSLADICKDMWERELSQLKQESETIQRTGEISGGGKSVEELMETIALDDIIVDEQSARDAVLVTAEDRDSRLSICLDGDEAVYDDDSDEDAILKLDLNVADFRLRPGTSASVVFERDGLSLSAYDGVLPAIPAAKPFRLVLLTVRNAGVDHITELSVAAVGDKDIELISSVGNKQPGELSAFNEIIGTQGSHVRLSLIRCRNQRPRMRINIKYKSNDFLISDVRQYIFSAD